MNEDWRMNEDQEEIFTMQLSATRVRKLAGWIQELPPVPENVASMEMLVNYDDAGQVKISLQVHHIEPPPEPPESRRTNWILLTLILASFTGTAIWLLVIAFFARRIL